MKQRIVQSDPRATGFTLIELLVVIAIISLLVSILIPSLQNARDLAKSTVCVTHLREISTMVFMYAHDYDGEFSLNPADNDYWGGSHNYWAGYQLCMMFDMKNKQGEFNVADSASPYEYIPLFACPATNGSAEWGESEGGYGVNAIATFADTGQVTGSIGGRPAPGGRIDQIPHPDHCFLYADVIPNASVGCNGTNPYSENRGCMPFWDGLSDRHLGCFNVVYWSGACESRSLDQFIDDYADIFWEITPKFGAGY